jgi:hypothetical protein
MNMAEKKKMIIDMGELPNLTPEERTKAQHIAFMEKYKPQREAINRKNRAKYLAEQKAKKT